MKVLKLALIGALAVCFTCPATGGMLKNKHITKKDVIRASKQLKQKDKAPRVRMKKHTKRWKRKAVTKQVTVEEIISLELERKIITSAQNFKQAAAENSTQQQAADFCEKNCRALNDDELYEAELELQRIRETTDPTASFKNYPWLLYEHSENCKHHPKEVPSDNGSQQSVQTPAEK